MIFYLENNFDSRINYFLTCKFLLGHEYRKRVKYIPYSKFLGSNTIRSGTYIFSDIERLSPRNIEWAEKYWRELESSGLDVRLYNEPIKVMRRYELLRTLHDKNYHDWNVYRLTDLKFPSKYPVFLRRENDHEGPITGLIENQNELENEIESLAKKGFSREDIVITEFCDSKDDDGIYKKFGAFYCGGKIIRRHLFFSKKWMIKYPDIRVDKCLREELDYVQSDLHEDAIQEIFELANIDYGRIDYTILNGKIQVWEINTNPHMVYFEEKNDPRSEINQIFYKNYVKALVEIDQSSIKSTRIDIANPNEQEWSLSKGLDVIQKGVKRFLKLVRK